VELDGGTLPNFAKVPQRHWQNQVYTNQFLYAVLAEEKCAEAGVEIAYYEFPQAVTKTEYGWEVTCVGFGTKRLMHLQPETGFRETYRIEGETLITVNDYTSGRLFDDAISYAFYPVDLYTRTGVKPKPLKRGVVPTIPLRALIPKGSCNIIVAGRCVSSDRLANSRLRVQASCMGMGQAAGVAAALAAKTGTTPLEVPVPESVPCCANTGKSSPARRRT